MNKNVPGIYWWLNEQTLYNNEIYIVKELGDNLWEAVTKMSDGKAKPICIIGIDKKAHEEEDDEEENNK